MKKITFNFILCFAFLFSASIFAQSTATYDITFTSVWNSNDHGTLPGNAHWSDLVGANHNSDITFFEMGGTATQGVEFVAEAGDNSSFSSEVTTAINAGNAEQWLQQSVNPFAAIASATLNDVVVSDDYPLLSLISMIAPSPDWVIAVNSINLWDTSENKWKETFTIDLFPYDAGTEDGFGYSGNNLPTNPRGVMTNVAGAAGYPFGTEKIGTLTITFKSTTLSVDDFDSIEAVKIFPNPSNTGEVTITNTSILSEIVIYDILGKKVKQHTPTTNSENVTIDVSDLNKGVYVVKLSTDTGSVESKKLIVN